MDVLIRNGTVIDGTGAERRRADVFVRNGKIAQIGEKFSASANNVVDASGLIVAPGFVDILNHADAYLTLLTNPASESLVAQGITTAVIGNCGASLAPVTHSRFLATFSKWAELRELNIDWERYGEFLETLERLRPGVNVAGLVGHATLRRTVLGNEARIPIEKELATMQALLEHAMLEGAFGLSLAPTYGHTQELSVEELDRLAGVVRDKNGYIAIHLREEAGDLLRALEEALAIAKRNNVSLEISHVKPYGEKAHGDFPQALAMIESAVKEDINVHFDVFPWQASFIVLYRLFPAWVREGGFIPMRKRLTDNNTAQKVFEELKRAKYPWEHYVIAETKRISDDIGKTVEETAKRMGVTAEEALIRLFLRHEGRVMLVRDSEERTALRKSLVHPRSFVASAGGGYRSSAQKEECLVHPRSFGAMPKFLSKFVLAEKLMTLEEGIAKVTGGPAKKVGLSDRGIIAEGKVADIVVFDPERLMNRATLTEPYQYPEGISWVFINGEIALRPEGLTGIRAGKPLRRGGLQ